MKREIKYRAWDGDRMIEWKNGVERMTFDITTWHNFHFMQFTGLKSIASNEDVYEDDVCSATFKKKEGIYNITGRIIMDDFMWCLQTDDDTYSLNRITIIDVLGNLYSNPELIKQ